MLLFIAQSGEDLEILLDGLQHLQYTTQNASFTMKIERYEVTSINWWVCVCGLYSAVRLVHPDRDSDAASLPC